MFAPLLFDAFVFQHSVHFPVDKRVYIGLGYWKLCIVGFQLKALRIAKFFTLLDDFCRFSWIILDDIDG